MTKDGKDDEWNEVAKGPCGRVLLGPEAKDEYDLVQAGRDELSVKRRVTLKRFFERFCTDRSQLNEDHLRRELSTSDGVGRGDQVVIWAFKAWKWRLYGAIFGDENGLPTFWGVVVDPDKKQNKADPKKLKRAGTEIGRTQAYAAYRGRREK